jgi:AraC-like DNA-binding protein
MSRNGSTRVQARPGLPGRRSPWRQLATEAGSGTAAHFNRQFLRRKAMTPRAFRASVHRGKNAGRAARARCARRAQALT